MKIFTNVKDVEQCATLQSDLQTVSEWCYANKMRLNVEKCYIISFTRKKNKLTYSYTIEDHSLGRRNIVKDLGVLIDEQLTFRPHYEYIVKRCHRLLGFIIRSTKNFKKPRSILNLFLSIARSILEYCSPVWSPYYNVHIDNIEKVQKKILKFISRKYNLGRTLKNYEQRLSKFGLTSLKTRRVRYDLLCLHKILHSFLDAPGLLSSLSINTRHRTRFPRTFTLDVYKNNTSYYNPIVRMCRTYNDLACSGKDSVVDIDIFNSKFSSYKKAVTERLKRDITH
ncbi:hypothetical protein ABMA28_001118 [Loxostege sticticalis]|uniref:RNA-directed DNA polymerase from mobile element jockey n=1 Tax=Loxostege sticticalis TaxID=481309 RepID=A0ABD0T4P6_LOXSC